jgi:hypothetical protein
MTRDQYRAFNSGRNQGRKGDFFTTVFRSTMNGVTGNMFGSKIQKADNAGYERGLQDRRDSRSRGRKRY